MFGHTKHTNESTVSHRAQKSKTKVRMGRDDKIYYAIVHILLILIIVIIGYPLIYIVSSSFSSPTAVSTGKVVLWPVDLSLEGYKAVFKNSDVLTGYLNTIIFTFFGTLINVIFTMFAAYPLASSKMPGRRIILFLFTFTMIFSGGMIPSYLLMRQLGIINTVWVMVLPGAMSVYNMIVARTFIQTSIPDELLEASKLDGCNDTQFFFRVVLPLSKAILAVLGIWYAVGHWNSFFNAFLYLSDQKLYPLQIFLRQILLQNNFDGDLMDEDMLAQIQNLQEVLKYAIIVISTAPLMMIYPFVQKYFVKGVMIGSVKG